MLLFFHHITVFIPTVSSTTLESPHNKTDFLLFQDFGCKGREYIKEYQTAQAKIKINKIMNN